MVTLFAPSIEADMVQEVAGVDRLALDRIAILSFDVGDEGDRIRRLDILNVGVNVGDVVQIKELAIVDTGAGR